MLWFVFKLELKQYLLAPFRRGKHTEVTSQGISNARAAEERASPLAELGHSGPEGMLAGSVWGLPLFCSCAFARCLPFTRGSSQASLPCCCQDFRVFPVADPVSGARVSMVVW